METSEADSIGWKASLKGARGPFKRESEREVQTNRNKHTINK